MLTIWTQRIVRGNRAKSDNIHSTHCQPDQLTTGEDATDLDETGFITVHRLLAELNGGKGDFQSGFYKPSHSGGKVCISDSTAILFRPTSFSELDLNKMNILLDEYSESVNISSRVTDQTE